MAAGDLVTLAEAKSFLRIPSSNANYDTLITALITQVTDRLQTMCCRVFAAGNYVERQNTGPRQLRAQVRNKPIIQINAVRWGQAAGIQVTYNGSAMFASVGVNTAGDVVLTQVATNGTTTTNTLAQATYPSFSTMAAAISAVSGFTGTMLGNINTLTKWLYPMPALPLITGGGTYVQQLLYPNVDAFAYITDAQNGTIGFSPMSTTDYFFPNAAGSMNPTVSFPGMYQGLTIDYRGGYETIPGDVKLVCLEVLKMVYDRTSKNGAIQSEQLADYQYTLTDPMKELETYRDRLAPYMKPALAGGIG